jgi:ribosomal protein L27
VIQISSLKKSKTSRNNRSDPFKENTKKKQDNNVLRARKYLKRQQGSKDLARDNYNLQRNK